MKTARLLILAGLAAACLASTGCLSRTISAASTRVEVVTETGRAISVTLPKETTAESLDLVINPGAGTYTLHATKLRTSGAPVIEAAGTANATAINALAGALQTLTATAAQGAAAAVLP